MTGSTGATAGTWTGANWQSYPDEGTLLILNGMGVPLYSGRDASFSATPIEQAAQTRRDVNGRLWDLALDQFKLYTLNIECTDQNPPAQDHIFPGQTVTVYWPAEFAVGGGSGTTGWSAGTGYTGWNGVLGRNAVPNSTRQEGAFTFYRPIFVAKVVSGPSYEFNEYKHEYSWKLILEEEGA